MQTWISVGELQITGLESLEELGNNRQISKLASDRIDIARCFLIL